MNAPTWCTYMKKPQGLLSILRLLFGAGEKGLLNRLIR